MGVGVEDVGGDEEAVGGEAEGEGGYRCGLRCCGGRTVRGGVLAGEDRGIGDREGWGYVDAVRSDDEVAVDALAVLEGEGGGVVVDGGDAVAEVDGDGGAGAGGGGGDVFEAAVEIDAVDVLPGLAGV